MTRCVTEVNIFGTKQIYGHLQITNTSYDYFKSQFFPIMWSFSILFADSPFNQANRQYKILEANQSTCPYHPICHPHIYQQKISSLYGKQVYRLKPVDHSFDALGQQTYPSLHRCLKNFRTFHSNKRKLLKENKNKFSQWPYLTSTEKSKIHFIATKCLAS